MEPIGNYGIEITVEGTFGDAIDRVKSVFKEHGFGTLTEIDVQKTLKEKIGAEMEPYTILGVCNPNLARRAIEAEHEIGLLLPCNVLVHQCGGRVRVSVQDPSGMMSFVGNPDLAPVGEEAREKLVEALSAVAG